MYKILNKQIIGNNLKRLEVTADVVAHKIKAGQFIIVMPDKTGERIPLSVVDTDAKKGTLTLIFEEVGFATKRLGAMSIGESIYAILGPLGLPAEIKDNSIIACVGYGASIVQLFGICRASRQAGSKVIGIMGAQTKRSLVLEPQMRLACHKLYITTEDGSYERRAFLTDILSSIFKKESVNLVYAAGPVKMLADISRLTRELNIKMLANLSPVILDGIGICGSCRVKVGGKEFLACIDGPEFDGHAVDYQDLMLRMDR